MNNIVHLDMDAYFASIEQRDAPLYKGKPLIVCHSEDLLAWKGIVSTASYEARPFGVKAGVSVWEAKSRCPKGIFVGGNYPKYLYNTRRLVDVCRRFSDLLEVFSIDEVFLDITRTWSRYGSPEATGRKIQATIRSELDLPVSVGLGPNKLVAKMASDFNKPEGFMSIAPTDLPDILAPRPVESLFGVGRRVGKYLRSVGVTTIGDLADYPLEKLQSRFGLIMGTALHCAALGIDNSRIIQSETDDLVKSFGHSSSLGSGTSDLKTLDRIIMGLTEGVTRRMRRQNYIGRTVTLRLGLDRLLFFTRSKTMPFPTDLTEPIVKVSRGLLRQEIRHIKRYPVTLIGVSVTNLIDKSRGYQPSLFDLDDGKKRRICVAVDSIKDKYGDDCISRGLLLGWRREFQNVPRIEISHPRFR